MMNADLLPKKLIITYLLNIRYVVSTKKTIKCRMSLGHCDYKIPLQLTTIHRIQLWKWLHELKS